MNLKSFINCTLATMQITQTPYGLIPDGCVVTKGDQIIWVGPRKTLPGAYKNAIQHDLQGRLVTPALIDCHTHAVFAGNRAHEFEMRQNGASYAEIAQAGGGIISTVTATRYADEDTLLAASLPRIDAMIAEGVTTIEVKSGYGLDLETELRMLHVARQIAHQRPVQITTTFLGAHAVPPEYAGNSGAYINDVCIPTLRAAHEQGLVDAVDAFCESIAFDTTQVARVFDVARELGLPIKIHAEQLSDMGGTALAAQYGALSADHIEYLNQGGIETMSQTNMTAVLLPGAFYTLRETQKPPVEFLRQNKVPIAVATDCNPGSSPMTSLLLTMNMAATLFLLTLEETLAGVTRNAARALGLHDRGIIAPNMRADLAIWNVEHPNELAYRIGFNPLHHRIFAGEYA